MPEALRHDLWTLVHDALVWAYDASTSIAELEMLASRSFSAAERLGSKVYLNGLWTDVLRRPINTRPSYPGGLVNELQAEFYKVLDWDVVYDWIDYHVSCEPEPMKRGAGRVPGLPLLQHAFNEVLAEHQSPWRFVDRQLVPISSLAEVAAVSEAKSTAPALVVVHLQRAIDAIADREAPDVHHAITESIQAVECMAKHVLGVEHGTLGKLVQSLEARGTHPAFAHAFSKFYGYTSDEGGLRHAFKPGQDPAKHIAEGRFFVVTASAFVNYLREVHGVAEAEVTSE